MFEVVFYRKRNGEEPALIHISKLEIKMRVKVYGNIEKLRRLGNELRYPDTDSLGDGIFELRTRLGTDIERLLFFFMDGKKIIITHGFIKKTQKTPQAEIEKAKEYRKDYLSR